MKNKKQQSFARKIARGNGIIVFNSLMKDIKFVSKYGTHGFSLKDKNRLEITEQAFIDCVTLPLTKKSVELAPKHAFRPRK